MDSKPFAVPLAKSGVNPFAGKGNRAMSFSSPNLLAAATAALPLKSRVAALQNVEPLVGSPKSSPVKGSPKKSTPANSPSKLASPVPQENKENSPVVTPISRAEFEAINLDAEVQQHSPVRKLKASPPKETHAERNSPKEQRKAHQQRRSIGSARKTREEAWKSVFTKRVDSAVTSLDDVMQSMEQQLKALESKADARAALVTEEQSAELARKLEALTVEKNLVDAEVCKLRAELDAAQTENTQSSETIIELTRQISQKMEEMSSLAQHLDAAKETLANFQEQREYERYKEQMQRAVNRELNEVFNTRHLMQDRQELAALRGEFEYMKEQYFMSTALSIKLSYSLSGSAVNVPIDELYTATQEMSIPSREWPAFITKAIKDALAAQEAAQAGPAPMQM